VPEDAARLRRARHLADEVGLGKTIEAGIVLKEYLLRGAVRTVLVLVPASLCEQWRAELWEKFELDFVVSRGPAGQWGRHPLVISSLETARPRTPPAAGARRQTTTWWWWTKHTACATT
jgi:SNF2 family DNA or RNA helicase